MRATVPQEARSWQLGEKQPLVEGPQALFVGGYLASGANCNNLTSGPLAVQAVALFASVFWTDVSEFLTDLSKPTPARERDRVLDVASLIN